MSTDSQNAAAGGEREPSSAEPTDAPPLNELQQAIVARARETIARRDAKPRKSRVQLLVGLAVALVAALLLFGGINYLVAEAQRMLAEYAASKNAESSQPAPQVSEEPGVVILQPERMPIDPSEPASAPPAEPPTAR